MSTEPTGGDCAKAAAKFLREIGESLTPEALAKMDELGLTAYGPALAAVAGHSPFLQDQARKSAELQSLPPVIRDGALSLMRECGFTFEAAVFHAKAGRTPKSFIPVVPLIPKPQPEREWATEPSRHVQGPRRFSRAKRKKLRAQGKL